MARSPRTARKPRTRLAAERTKHMRVRKVDSTARYLDPQTGRMVTVKLIRQTQSGRWTISVAGQLRSVTPEALR